MSDIEIEVSEHQQEVGEEETEIVETEAKTSIVDQVQAIGDEVAHRFGLRIYDIEFGNGPTGKVLRISIDHPERGVGIEDCSNVSRGVSEALDAHEDMIPGHYALEVSSPGLERHLKKPWHFQASVGKKVKLKARKSFGDFGLRAEALKGGRQLKDELKAADETGVTFELGGETLRLPYDMIEKAQVVFEYGNTHQGEPVNKTPQGKPKPGHRPGSNQRFAPKQHASKKKKK